MSDTKSGRQILVWVPDNQDKERAGLPNFRGPAALTLKPVKVDADQIASSLRDLVESLEPALSISLSKPGFSVDELELNLTLSADGEVGFVASVSAGIEASITLKMKRH